MKISDELKKEIKRTVLELLLLLCLPLIVVTGVCIKEHFDKHFTHFNAKRTALMEEITETLKLETDDYERFMSENVNAELELDESRKGRDFLLYKYKYKSKNVSKQLSVESLENGKYLITLTYWD